MTDEFYIKRAIELARKGIGHVSPNPLVGAVIVKDGTIVGKGYHQRYGEAHAEVNAIRDAGESARGATLYVNLEPCCHQGKTPPCTEAIIHAGIRRVVVGMVDPNPLVNNLGISCLRDHGIDVTAGIAAGECEELNKVFIKYMKTGLPYITIKIAQTIDGRIATQSGHSKWITSPEARTVVHRLRSENDGIVIGVRTGRLDNPSLTVRRIAGENPFRIVLDSQLSIPEDSKLLNDKFTELTIIATASGDVHKKERIRRYGARLWELPSSRDGYLSLTALLEKAASEKLSSLLVEGGSEVFTSFLREKLADYIAFMIAPKISGSGINAIGDLNIFKIDHSITLNKIKLERAGEDIVLFADIKYPR